MAVLLALLLPLAAAQISKTDWIFTVPECTGCLDYYGRCRSPEEVWTDDDTWQYRCEATTPTLLGCLSYDGEALLAPGSEKTIDGFWHKCEQSARRLRYEQEHFCEVGGAKMHVGDTFRDRVFQKSCQEWGIGVDGCFYQEEDGAEVFLRVGESGSVGLVSHHCVALPERPSRIQYYTSVPRTRHGIRVMGGKTINGNLPPVDSLNFLGQVPRPWLQAEVTDYIRNDGLYRAKIRYLD